MKHSRLLFSALLVSTAFIAGCKEGTPAGPSPAFDALHADLLSDLRNSSGRFGMLSCRADTDDERTDQTVGAGGGVIRIGPHTLIIPAGALSSSVKITARLDDNGVNHVEFQPEGLQFKVPATLIMSYANCDTRNLNADHRIAYTDLSVSRIHYRLESSDDRFSRRVTAKLNHFSDYAVAW